jgi:hypothetical protein
MTPSNSRFGFPAALAILTILSAAALQLFNVAPPDLHTASLAFYSALAIFGTVTVTYTCPVQGVTAPTAAEAKSEVRGNVIATSDADTTAVITHNFGLTTAQLAAGLPEVTLIPLHTDFYLSTWTVAYTDGDTVTLTKGTAGSSGGANAQCGFIVRRPHSIGRS